MSSKNARETPDESCGSEPGVGAFTHEEIENIATGHILDELEKHDIAVAPTIVDGDKRLVFGNGAFLPIQSVAADLESVTMNEWQDHLDRWADFAVQLGTRKGAADIPASELRGIVRARVVPADYLDGLSYARPLEDGLVEALALDFPDRVGTVTDAVLEQLALGVDELFAHGEANTVAEPIDSVSEENGVMVASGDSLYLASKIVDIPGFLEDQEVDAPDGLLFAIPNRHALLWKVPQADSALGDVMALAQLVQILSPENGFEAPGGMLSRQVFYWSPDGVVEVLMAGADHSREAIEKYNEESGETIDPDQVATVVPGERFTERFL
ncbi:MAG: hypothetical protein E7A62_07915 [Actinomycetaceae bacterium]|nr:hypothetical protein [Actinomycetaceae bacterium]MDU0970902.1 hypothetical protein [Actinomycetaceae bacterium]